MYKFLLIYDQLQNLIFLTLFYITRSECRRYASIKDLMAVPIDSDIFVSVQRLFSILQF